MFYGNEVCIAAIDSTESQLVENASATGIAHKFRIKWNVLHRIDCNEFTTCAPPCYNKQFSDFHFMSRTFNDDVTVCTWEHSSECECV